MICHATELQNTGRTDIHFAEHHSNKAEPADTSRCAQWTATLGSGASLCALLAGKSVATTMSFTPLDGLLMGTRAGAIDPGVVLYLLRHERMTPQQVEYLLDRESGLLGVSGISSDMRDLLTSLAPEAAEAVDLFCYRVAREVGAMAAAVEGLDAIVFTGGIGENSPEVREKVCDRLGWLGVGFDHAANRAGATRLNTAGSRVSILRVPADEEAVIARHAAHAIHQDRLDPESNWNGKGANSPQ